MDEQIRVLLIGLKPGGLDRVAGRAGPGAPLLEVHRVDAGPDALDALDRLEFDVIVSAMKVRRQTGVELLETIAEKKPGTVRILIVNNGEADMSILAAGAAHLFLNYQTTTAELRQTVLRAFGMRRFLEDETLRAVVARMSYLPSLPKLFNEVMAEAESTDPNLRKISELVAQDPGLSAKMLQMANSAFFGFIRQVSDAKEAVILMGLDTVKAIVLSDKIFNAFKTSKTPPALLNAIWRHSLAVGGLARALAKGETWDKDLISTCFTAGMLHDIGKLVFAANYPERYRQVLIMARKKMVPLSQLEQDVFHADHAAVGAYLLGLWGLPLDLVEAVALHHQPESTAVLNYSPLTAVHVANSLNHQLDATLNGLGQPEVSDLYLTETRFDDRLPLWAALAKSMDGQTPEIRL